MTNPWTPRYLASIADADGQAWNRLFGSASEGFDYYLACERAVPPAFSFAALGLFDHEQLIAGAPAFRGNFRLDLMLKGRSRQLAAWLGDRFPQLINLAVMGVGSPYADGLAMVFDPSMDAAQRCRALEGLLDALQGEAESAGIGVTFLKNVSDSDRVWAHEILQRGGYVRMAALPIAALAIPASEEDYIASLSANMRSNLRRKLKRARGLRVEIRSSIGGLEEVIHGLWKATRSRASTDYDAFSEISGNYVREVLAGLGERAKLLLYWKGEDLIAFAVVLIEPGRLIEKCNGMRYPEGPDNGVFFLNWMTQVRMCIKQRIPVLDAGETTYLTKVRLGCRLHRSWIYFRHRLRSLNWMFWLGSRLTGLISADPDLRKLGSKAPYVDPEESEPALRVHHPTGNP